MLVKLLRQNKIDGKAGDIVEVSPARAAFLFEFKLAVPVSIREQIETPEKKTAAVMKETRKAGPEKKPAAAKKTTAKAREKK